MVEQLSNDMNYVGVVSRNGSKAKVYVDGKNK